MSDIPDKLDHNAKLLKTLVFPEGTGESYEESLRKGPPSLVKMEIIHPDVSASPFERTTFRLTWSHGVTMEGPLGDVLMQRP